MKRTKTGAVPIPREAWRMVAREHLNFADELIWIVGRSLSNMAHLLKGNTQPLEDAEDGSRSASCPDWLFNAAVARGRAEAEVFDAADSTEMQSGLAKFEAEFHCLAATLRCLADSHLSEARTAQEIAASVRPGRPRATKRSALAALIEKPQAKPSKRRRGRPPAEAISNPELIALVERGRTEYGDESARDSIRRFAKKHVEDAGTSSGWRSRDETNALVTRLEKRLSRARAALPKSGAE